MAFLFASPEKGAATGIKKFSDRPRKRHGGHKVDREAAEHNIH
jgi:hypothetical protein